jgi:hypothetical protein
VGFLLPAEFIWVGGHPTLKTLPASVGKLYERRTKFLAKKFKLLI